MAATNRRARAPFPTTTRRRAAAAPRQALTKNATASKGQDDHDQDDQDDHDDHDGQACGGGSGPSAVAPAPAPVAPRPRPRRRRPGATDSDSDSDAPPAAAPAPPEPPEPQALPEPEDPPEPQEPQEPHEPPVSAVSETGEGRRPARLRRVAIVQDAKSHFDTLRNEGQISTKQYDDVQKVMHAYVEEGKVAQSNTFVSVLIDIVGHLAKPSGTQTPVQTWSKEPATAELQTTKETLRNATQLMHNLQPCVEQMEETMALLQDLVPKLAASTHATSRQLLSVAQAHAGSA